jgi:Uma2 family endonuclease
MAEQVAPASQPNLKQPDASAETISADEYMAQYAHDFYEWVKGELIKISPVSEKHDALTRYFTLLLEAYFSLNPIGKLRQEPFVMRLDATESRREPDLQVILNTNPGNLTKTAMVGPADICIEVVSEESVARDHGEKFAEYEKAGVREYWIVDPLRDTCRFNRLNEAGVYIPVGPGQDGLYETPLLPGLKLDVAILWREQLPDYFEIGRAVQEMVEQG